MSDHQDSMRPAKRRRRHSVSRSPSSDRNETENGSRTSQRDDFFEPSPRKRPAAQDRSYNSGARRSRRSESRDDDRREKSTTDRRRRSRSREAKRDGDRQGQSRSQHHRERSLSPRRDHSRRSDREREHHRRDHGHDRRQGHSNGEPRPQSPKAFSRSKAPLPSQNDAFTATADPSSALVKPVEKQKPNFGLTGKLAAASNTIQTANQTIVLKYHEPPEARKPPARDHWRLYVFKEDEILETVELSEQSCWLFGRETAVADFVVEHTSCSKQHAVIQFRHLEKRNEFGDKIGKVKPYVIDLESANGTRLNEDPVPAAKYVELRDKDVLKFGHSSREYVIQLPPSL